MCDADEYVGIRTFTISETAENVRYALWIILSRERNEVHQKSTKTGCVCAKIPFGNGRWPTVGCSQGGLDSGVSFSPALFLKIGSPHSSSFLVHYHFFSFFFFFSPFPIHSTSPLLLLLTLFLKTLFGDKELERDEKKAVPRYTYSWNPPCFPNPHIKNVPCSNILFTGNNPRCASACPPLLLFHRSPPHDHGILNNCAHVHISKENNSIDQH